MPQIMFSDKIRKELEAIKERYTVKHKKKHVQIWIESELAITLPYVRSRAKGGRQDQNGVASIRQAVRRLREKNIPEVKDG